MKAKLRISQIHIEVEIESGDPDVGAEAQRLINANQESIEAAMAEGVIRHVERLLPGVKVNCAGTIED